MSKGNVRRCARQHPEFRCGDIVQTISNQRCIVLGPATDTTLRDEMAPALLIPTYPEEFTIVVYLAPPRIAYVHTSKLTLIED